jgi:RNA polymerase sigma-70 factor, ECF subfamily
VHAFLPLLATVAPQPRGKPDDATILGRIARGEDQALAELYDRYTQLLYTLGMRILRSVQDSEDVVQEVFMQAWNKAGTYEPGKGTVYAWLVTMMRNRAIDRLRSKGFRHSAQSADVAGLLLSADPASSSPHSYAVHTEDQKLVLATLKELSVDQQQVLVLAYYEGFSQSEIAKKLNIPLGTVKSRIRKGLQSMHSMMKGKI